MLSNFTLFGLDISMLSVMSFIGICLAVPVALWVVKKKGLSVEDALYALLFAAVGLVIFAKLFYVWFSMPEPLFLPSLSFMDNVVRFCSFMMSGGLVFYGGLIGAFIGGVLYLKLFKLHMFSYVDAVIVIAPFFHIFGRIGCFLTGCCHGKEYDGFLAVTYTNSLATQNGVSYFPIQLFEAMGNVLIFALLLYLVFKTSWVGTGKITGMYLLCYSVLRFVLEFFRGDEIRGIFSGFSSSQWVSLVLLPISILLLLGFGRFLESKKVAEAHRKNLKWDSIQKSWVPRNSPKNKQSAAESNTAE